MPLATAGKSGVPEDAADAAAAEVKEDEGAPPAKKPRRGAKKETSPTEAEAKSTGRKGWCCDPKIMILT